MVLKPADGQPPAFSLEHQAFDLAGVGMAYIKGDRFVRVNQAFCDLIGYTATEIEGASFFDFVPDDKIENKRADFALLREQARSQVTFDESYFHRDGREVWVSLTAKLISPGLADRLIVAHDITARIMAERQIRREHDKLESALSSMSDAVFMTDATGSLLDHNAAFATFHRLPENAEAFHRLDQFTEAFDAFTSDGEPVEASDWPVARALRGEAGVDHRLIIGRKDSDERWFASFNFAPLRAPDGSASGAIVAARDITDRVLADQQLQAERDKLKAALFSMPDAVYIGNGRMADPDFNDAFVSFLRFPNREHTFRTLADLAALLDVITLAGEFVAFDQWPVSRALRGEVGVGQQFKLRRTDTGEWWFASCNFAPIQRPDGTNAGCVLIMRDITEAKLAEDALLASREELEIMVDERTQGLAEAKLEADRANAAKTRFLAAASHDLRQPLQAAKAYLGVLERLPPGSNISAIIAGLETALSVMGGLLGSMLDMSRLQSGFVEPLPTIFPLATLLEEIAHANLPAAQNKGLEMRTNFQQCLVSTDRALLLSAVHNLLSNAVKYTEQGFVAVRCIIVDDLATIEIEDSGIGISDDDRSSIFLEYVQLANAARNPEHGVGLGLSLVKSSLDLLGITLRMESQVGQGTRFAFDLPCVATSDATDHLPSVAQGPDNEPSVILVIEDDTAVRDAFVVLLEIYGHTVHSVATGAEALDFVAVGKAFDVMLTDYRLPDTFGTDVIREARKMRGVAFPAILITGDTQLDDIRAQNIENCRVMSKPVKVPVVIETIAQLTRPSAQIHRNRA